MHDSTEFLRLLKKAALDAMEAGQPTDVCFGTVQSVAPLKIFINQKMILGAAQLVLSRNVTDYTVSVSMNWATENKGHSVNDEDAFASHNHSIVSEKGKTITIHNALMVGEKVILLRQKGGQQYIVLDRVVSI